MGDTERMSVKDAKQLGMKSLDFFLIIFGFLLVLLGVSSTSYFASKSEHADVATGVVHADVVDCGSCASCADCGCGDCAC